MRIDIDLAVIFATPFNVGTGALAEVSSDLPTLKDGQFRPVIPGSSLKGRLRHTCEALLRALDADRRVCRGPSPEALCPLDPAGLGDYCPICRLFGAPRRPSGLIFDDLRVVESAVQPPAFVRTGVSIRRNRRVAEAQRLYDMEAVAPTPDTVFRGRVGGRLDEPDTQALVALLWAGLRHQSTLGSGRTGGLGHCRIEPTITIDGQPATDGWLEEGLRRWLA